MRIAPKSRVLSTPGICHCFKVVVYYYWFHFFIIFNKKMKYIDIENSLVKLKPVFTAKDIQLAGFKVFPYQLNRWVKADYIQRLAAGHYVFSRSVVSPEHIANQLRQPSYVSLEYALYWHGFTVDIPFHITSVTTKTTRTIMAGPSAYSYLHVKPALFCGFTAIELGTANEVGKRFYIATPEKALVDLLYLRPNAFKNNNQFTEARFHEEELKAKLDWRGVFAISQIYNNKSLRKRLEQFKEYIFSC